MVIQFLCPNGHRIHCDAKRAGLAAKCPKCGEKFRIPTLSELEAAGAIVEEASAPQAGEDPSQAAAPASAIGRGPATSAAQVEFLCPNNHLIHAPVELQGKPGQCPQCGSKFRVPSYDERAGAEEQPEALAVDSLGGGYVEAIEDVPPLEEQQAPVAPVGDEGSPPSLPAEETARLVVPAAAPHPFFGLFCRLWSHKAEGTTMEIRYGEGQRFAPDRFAKGLSTGSHAVFAVDEPNGTYVLTTISWDSICAVVIRGAKSLPDEMET